MTTTGSKPKKYLHENLLWYKTDRFGKCHKEILKCSKGYAGHFSEHLNQTHSKFVFNEETKVYDLFLKVDYYIHHSHFISDLDKGRHVRCKIGSDFIRASDPAIKKMYRLGHRNPPDWVKDELDS